MIFNPGFLLGGDKRKMKQRKKVNKRRDFLDAISCFGQWISKGLVGHEEIENFIWN